MFSASPFARHWNSIRLRSHKTHVAGSFRLPRCMHFNWIHFTKTTETSRSLESWRWLRITRVVYVLNFLILFGSRVNNKHIVSTSHSNACWIEFPKHQISFLPLPMKMFKNNKNLMRTFTASSRVRSMRKMFVLRNKQAFACLATWWCHWP